MKPAASSSAADLAGVGLALRWEFLDELLQADPASLADVSFFEVSPENYMRRGGHFPDALARVAERQPLTTHGLMLSLGGTDPLDLTYIAELKAFLARFGGAWHSDHLSFSTQAGVAFHDLLPVPFTAATAARIAARVREASDRLERPLAVENVSYYARLGESTLAEPDFIAEILERADCGLLLDVNNLDVNAQNHHFDAEAWLARLPLARVCEIHVAGPEASASGVLLDTHGARVRLSALELLRSVLERTGPKPVLLERDHNVPSLRELLIELSDVKQVYQRALDVWRTRREAGCAA